MLHKMKKDRESIMSMAIDAVKRARDSVQDVHFLLAAAPYWALCRGQADGRLHARSREQAHAPPTTTTTTPKSTTFV